MVTMEASLSSTPSPMSASISGARPRSSEVAATLSTEKGRETLCVVGCVHLRVVVEVDVGVAASGTPPADPGGPGLQLLIRVATHVELRRSVQPDVNEVCRESFGVPELAGRVRDDEPAVVRT